MVFDQLQKYQIHCKFPTFKLYFQSLSMNLVQYFLTSRQHVAFCQIVIFEYDWQLGSSFLTVEYPGTSHVLFIMTDLTFFLYKFVLKVAGLQRKIGQSYLS